MKSSEYPSFTALGAHILRQRFVSALCLVRPPQTAFGCGSFFKRNYKASENSSGETPAILSALRSVPNATPRCIGMTQPRSPSVVIF
jgi:hypothetical protein